ncbi:MAG: YqiJ family protein [Desulfotalea sp.]
MLSFFFESQNLPFAVSIALMFFIALLEGVGTVLGAGLSGFLDNVLPDFDLDLDVDTPDIDGSSGITKFLGWLRFGEVPALMILIVFLTAFGLIGLGVQTVILSVTGYLLPAFVAIVPAFLFSMPVVRIFAGLLGRFMPRDETYAVSQKDFIGRVVTITLGSTVKGKPTRAKFCDQFGTTHYIMIEPDEEDKEYNHGQSLLIVSQEGAIFMVIENTKEMLK